MANTLNWGILGLGNIALRFAQGVAKSKTGKLVAVGSRTQEKADKFAAGFPGAKAHGSYEALLADKNVQAVYIATPHPQHPEWVFKTAQAGKHILCEKPLAINHPTAMAMIEAAVQHDVFLMEAYMYRCHPLTAKLVELLKNKTIGDVRLIRCTFAFQAGFDPNSRLFKNDLAGGGILDVGGYTTSMARLLAGAAVGKDFAEPTEVKGCGVVGTTGTDDYAVASLKFPGDIVAQCATGVLINLDNLVQVFGTEGNITVPLPWIITREGGTSKIILKLNKEKAPQEILVETAEYLYGLEADTVARYLEKRQAAAPAMSWDDTLGNLKVQDAWRAAIGQEYDREKPGNVATVHGNALAVRKDAKPRMKYGMIAGVDLPVSRLVMGCDNQKWQPHGAAIFDDFFERGGNGYDTAWVYGSGQCERTLGQWVKNRGLRKQVVILDKGAHTPFCDPASLVKQFAESLDRMQMDYADIYMMHRDNLQVPVGEFIDALNQLHRAGRMKAFGGSNWSLARVEEANNYATAHGLTGFAAVSNNFSLARMIDAPWGGCLASSDSASRQWFKRRQLPLMPWSSQAQGFFTGRAEPDKRTEPELVRCWYSDDNFKRLARVRELAAKRNVLPVTIALAYVLAQPFPTFPLIGPRQICETRTSFAALAVELTPEEVAWLNLDR